MTDVGRLWITVLTKTFMEDGMMKMDKSVLMDESEVWKLRNLNSVKRRKQMAHVMQMVMIAARGARPNRVATLLLTRPPLPLCHGRRFAFKRAQNPLALPPLPYSVGSRGAGPRLAGASVCRGVLPPCHLPRLLSALTRYSAICTALRAAPLRIWSPESQKVSPLSSARSLRTRPTKTSSLPAVSSGMG